MPGKKRQRALNDVCDAVMILKIEYFCLLLDARYVATVGKY